MENDIKTNCLSWNAHTLYLRINTNFRLTLRRHHSGMKQGNKRDRQVNMRSPDRNPERDTNRDSEKETCDKSHEKGKTLLALSPKKASHKTK